MSGITVNSLTSVSLSPLLLLWCLGDQSERYSVFAEADAWGVTVLGGNEEALARRFAQADYETIAPHECEYLSGVPILKAGVAHFACATRERTKGGDHLIILGEVLDFRAAPGPALTFFRGRYGRIDDPGSESGSK
jgi:3-hydroxy-9,10-secoandrosta-1,3,5(10)-triene-9,17-dione monooxygenase reductase component